MNNPKISLIITYSDCESAVNEFIESLKNQKFTDYEAVFVNCCSNEYVIKIVSENVSQNEKWNIITLPDNNDCETAKQAALNIVSGEFVCFINAKNMLEENFLGDICNNYYKKEISALNAENNKIYRRSFIENNSELRDIIKIQIQNEIQKFSEKFKRIDESLKEKLDDCYRNSDELVSNKFYNIIERMNFLEKLIQEKENLLNSNIENAINSVTEQRKIEEIKVNNNLHQISEKEEILNILHQKENSFDIKLQEQNSKFAILEQKFEDFCKVQDEKYNSLMKLINESQKDINLQIEALNIMSAQDSNDKLKKVSDLIQLEENMKKNFDAVYSLINENNKRFYNELTSLYKETDEKIRKK